MHATALFIVYRCSGVVKCLCCNETLDSQVWPYVVTVAVIMYVL